MSCRSEDDRSEVGAGRVCRLIYLEGHLVHSVVVVRQVVERGGSHAVVFGHLLLVQQPEEHRQRVLHVLRDGVVVDGSRHRRDETVEGEGGKCVGHAVIDQEAGIRLVGPRNPQRHQGPPQDLPAYDRLQAGDGHVEDVGGVGGGDGLEGLTRYVLTAFDDLKLDLRGDTAYPVILGENFSNVSLMMLIYK